MSIDVSFSVPLEPHAKGRPRVVRNGGMVRTFTPSETTRWEQDFALVARAYLPREVIEGPLRVDLLFVLPRPASLLRRKDPDGLVWAPKRPDRDNLEKSVLDALNTAWRDDAQVVCGEPLKCYAERDGRPRVVCRIRAADAFDPATMVAALGLSTATGGAA